MVSYCRQSLFDLCGIQIAYLMWTRRKLPRKYLTDELFIKLANVVSADVRELHLPKQCEYRILKHVSCTGKQLLTLLSVWMSKTQFENSLVNPLENMLFDSLILNADGLINPRQTAEELLGSRRLPSIFAFRLACINFLEMQVLKLLIYVKDYFLNKLVFRAEETEEVLFWIRHCLLKENLIDVKKLRHFSGTRVDWHEYALKCAVSAGNVACFDYFKKFHSGKIEYSYLKLIENIFLTSRFANELYCSALDYQQSSFIFHFVLLSSEEKVELFCKFPKKMVYLFLNWPLSQTFVEYPEEIWNLIPDEFKSWVFVHIFKVSFGEHVSLMYLSDFKPICETSGKYIYEHLVSIWIDLWKISVDSYKLAVLNQFVFLSIKTFTVRSGFRRTFNTSNVRERLLRLFLSNGEVVLELYGRENLKESLRSLVAKYIPEILEELDRRYISFPTKPHEKKKFPRDPNYRFSPRDPCHPVHEKFLVSVKEILFSSSRN